MLGLCKLCLESPSQVNILQCRISVHVTWSVAGRKSCCAGSGPVSWLLCWASPIPRLHTASQSQHLMMYTLFHSVSEGGAGVSLHLVIVYTLDPYCSVSQCNGHLAAFSTVILLQSGTCASHRKVAAITSWPFLLASWLSSHSEVALNSLQSVLIFLPTYSHI